jgi:hypothetical protein
MAKFLATILQKEPAFKILASREDQIFHFPAALHFNNSPLSSRASCSLVHFSCRHRCFSCSPSFFTASHTKLGIVY